MKYLTRQFPFPHLVIAPVLKDVLERDCIGAMNTADWEVRETDFYHLEVPARGKNLDELLRTIKASLPWDAVRIIFEKHFNCRLSSAIRFEIHRYAIGSGIGAHTDAALPEVRFVLNLNADWNHRQGNVWILAVDSALAQQRSYLPSISNSGFAFATNRTSYHALSTRTDGVGYGVTARFARVR